VLADPSVQNVTPLIYRSALSTPGRAVLNSVSAKLTTADLLRMNVRILVDRTDPRTVARVAETRRTCRLSGAAP
jgi:osmoprotectant transport system substrate-binding protein